MGLALPILAALTVAVPHLTATRTEHPPILDGALDDDVWRETPPSETFVQKFPDEGKSPSEHTAMRVAYDDEALYVSFDCRQENVPVTAHLTRRDRTVESDWVSVSIDTRRDGKSAFEFNVNAAGVLVDSIHFNDTDISSDWDENWDARTQTTAHGWTAEIRIPMRIVRFTSMAVQSWGFEARRYVSQRQETDEWAFIPRSVAGEVSHYGKLDGLKGLKALSPLEARPFVLGRARRRDAAVGQLANGTDLGVSAGIDLKWHATQDLTLDVAINPDFAQVEADQVVLNLTTFETYYPEKRPFFLEGIDTFATPMQLLYTRRIGRAAASPALRTTYAEQLVDVPSPATIYGASKLTGRLSDNWEVGSLSAVTARNDVQVQLPDGRRVLRLADPMTAFNVGRVKRAIGENAYIGATLTSTTHVEPTTTAPIVSNDPSSPNPYQLCPDGSSVRPGSRCSQDAYVAAADWRWRSHDGDYVSAGQVAVSLLERGPDRLVADGTSIHPGMAGTGATGWIGKEGGKHWIGDVYGNLMSRNFDINDMGYNTRANQILGGADIAYRTLEPFGAFLETTSRVECYAKDNVNGLRLTRGCQIHNYGKLSNYWRYFGQLEWHSSHFDDREVGDGTALERAGNIAYDLAFAADPRARVSTKMESYTQMMPNGFSENLTMGLMFRALPQLDLETLPTFLFANGEPRYAALGDRPGRYVFGRQRAKNWGMTLRATYTFTPRLTLQAYAQLFLASIHYDDFSTIDSDPNAPRPIVHLADLHYGAPRPSTNPDTIEGALNINIVLRWEYRIGSLVYLVYTRSQTPSVTVGPTETGTLNFGSVGRAPASDVVLLKLSYWWG